MAGSATPRWLKRSIVFVVVTMAGTAVGWSAGCMSASMRGNQYGNSESCKNHEERASQTLLALLTTLISLRSNPPNE